MKKFDTLYNMLMEKGGVSNEISTGYSTGNSGETTYRVNGKVVDKETYDNRNNTQQPAQGQQGKLGGVLGSVSNTIGSAGQALKQGQQGNGNFVNTFLNYLETNKQAMQQSFGADQYDKFYRWLSNPQTIESFNKSA
jgi:hypothetical protein